MEVICINGTFSPEVLDFFNKHNVVVPQEDAIYHIREFISHTIGKQGVKLVEIINPSVPQVVPALGKVNMEPSFDINRFAKLDMTAITKEELKLCLTN